MNVRVGVGTSVVVGGITDVVKGRDTVADVDREGVGLRLLDHDSDSVRECCALCDRVLVSCCDSLNVRE